jgi:hypothetical protein
LRENDQPTEIAPGKGWGAKKNQKKKKKRIQAYCRASDDSRSGVEVERRELKAGPCELGYVARGVLEHLPASACSLQGEARRGGGTRQFLPVFLLLFAGAPTGHDSVDDTRQAGRVPGGRRFDCEFAIHPPSPSGRVHALTPVFLRPARVGGRSFGIGNAIRAGSPAPLDSGLGRHVRRMDLVGRSGPGLLVADESGSLFTHSRWPLRLTAIRCGSRYCTGWYRFFG